VIVAQVARLALDPSGDPVPPSSEDDASFSEKAMYVLVCRNADWWLAAGQNTRMRPWRRGLGSQSHQLPS
jgi:hypothetical protein